MGDRGRPFLFTVMLFNSYEFLFLFLPCVFAIHRILLKYHAPLPCILGWLCTASLFFYSWWRPEYLLLLSTSLAFNYGIARCLKQSTRQIFRKLALTTGTLLNVFLLAYFKYTGFLLLNLTEIGLWHDPVPDITLPLAISFFTFQQIAYLVTCYREPESTCSLLEHVFFISFFPHLIAGPIVYKNELVDQVRQGKLFTSTPLHWQQGLALFIIGLSKKLLIGDNIAPLIGPLYDTGGPEGSYDAWLGSFLFGFQIYFDFSAYSDMALGLAALFGLKLPINFDSPYKATTYREFWRLWHVTLFRFLRDYIYIPLCPNAPSAAIKACLGFLVFLLSGLWHGAAWTFVAWGVLNWILVVINDVWIHFWERTGMTVSSVISQTVGRIYVFIAMSLTFMLFRSPDFKTAWTFLKTLFTSSDTMNSQIVSAIAQTRPAIFLSPSHDILAYTPLLAVILLLILVWKAPNAVRYTLHDDHPGPDKPMPSNAITAACLGILAWMSIMSIPNSTQFLYFQF